MTPEEKLLALIQQDKRTEDRDKKTEISEPATPVVSGSSPASGANLPVSMPPAAASSGGLKSELPGSIPSIAPVAPISSISQTQAPLPQPVAQKSGAVVPEVRTPLAPAIPVRGDGGEKPAPVEKKIKLAVAEPVVGSQVAKLSGESPKGTLAGRQVAESALRGLGEGGVLSKSQEASSTSTTQQPNNLATEVSDAPLLAAGPSFRPSRSIKFVYLNRVLAVVVLVLAAVVFYSVGSTRRGIAEDLERQVNGAGSMSEPPVIVSEDRVGLQTYLDKVSSRNIFVPKLAAKVGQDAGPALPVGVMKDLKLVAVSVDSSSIADSMAIIKNKADSKTYFVKLGQTVGGTDYVLDRVLPDRVILKQRKQEFELK